MKAALYVLLLMLATSAFPWSRYDAHTNPISEEQQQKIEELQRRLEQAEFERQLESADRERAASEAADEARQEAEERAREAAEQAEQDVEDVRNEMIRSAVRTKNNFYLIVLLLLMGVFVTHIVKKFNKEKSMDENQKYGVVTMISSFLLTLLALMISEGWEPRMDYLENLMNSLRIELIEIENKNYKPADLLSYPYYHLIYWPSKYVVLALLAVGAYGLTTYLGITPAFRPWRGTSPK